jgi:hypothetical protein
MPRGTSSSMQKRLLALLVSVASACVAEFDPPEVASGDGDGDGDGDGEDGDGVEPAPALLVAEGCEVEVLWSMPFGEDPRYVLNPFWEGQHGAFLAGAPGEFVIAGEAYRGEDKAQVVLKLVDTQIAWIREYVGTDPPSGSTSSEAQHVVGLDDGLRVLGGFSYPLDGSWMTAYSAQGELEWVQPGLPVQWEDALAHAGRVYATGNLYVESTSQARVEAFAADGSTVWDFNFESSVWSLGIAADSSGVWVVGAQLGSTNCAWVSRFTHEGQLEMQVCTDVEEGADEIFTTAVALPGGGLIAAGGRYSTKPKNVGHIHFGEPLVVVFDSAGVEQSRWTPGEGVFDGGRIAHMVGLPSGEFVSIVALEDLIAEPEEYDKAVIYEHDSAGKLLGRCELDRPTIPEYAATPVALALGSTGELFLLLAEGQAISTMPNDDPSDFPPVPEDFGGYSILRIWF